MFGFPMGKTFTGSDEDKQKVRKDYERKIGFSKKTNSPIWNGEFGPVYATEEVDGPDFQKINDARYAALGEQLRVYKVSSCAYPRTESKMARGKQVARLDAGETSAVCFASRFSAPCASCIPVERN